MPQRALEWPGWGGHWLGGRGGTSAAGEAPLCAPRGAGLGGGRARRPQDVRFTCGALHALRGIEPAGSEAAGRPCPLAAPRLPVQSTWGGGAVKSCAGRPHRALACGVWLRRGPGGRRARVGRGRASPLSGKEMFSIRQAPGEGVSKRPCRVEPGIGWSLAPGATRRFPLEWSSRPRAVAHFRGGIAPATDPGVAAPTVRLSS